MTSPLLYNKSLEDFIKSIKLETEDEERVLKMVPTLDEDERIILLKALVTIYLLNEEEDYIKKLSATWKKFTKDPSEANLQELQKIQNEES